MLEVVKEREVVTRELVVAMEQNELIAKFGNASGVFNLRYSANNKIPVV